jgi:hypothetical protein
MAGPCAWRLTLPTQADRRAGKVGTDLALLKVRQEDAVDAAFKQPGQVCLPHAQRQLANVLAVGNQDVEGVELNFVLCDRRRGRARRVIKSLLVNASQSSGVFRSIRPSPSTPVLPAGGFTTSGQTAVRIGALTLPLRAR